MIRLGRLQLAAAVALLAAVAVAVVLVVVLSDGDDGSTARPGDASPTPTPPPFAGGTVQQAVAYYVSNVGLGGTTYEVTNPVNCNAFVLPEDAERLQPDGKICLNLNSAKFDDTSGTLTVNLFGRDMSWSLTFELAGSGWAVTEAEAISPSGQGS